MILAALVTTLLMLFILFLLPLAEKVILPQASSNMRHLHIKASSISGQFLADIYETCTRNKVAIEKLTVIPEQEGEEIGIICRIPDQETISKVIGELHTLTDIKAIHADLRSPDA